MNDDIDLRRFDDIGDPFADAAETPLAPLTPGRVAELARPSPTRSRVRALRGIAAGGALLLAVGWVALRHFRPDLRAASAPAIALQLAIPLVAAAVALGAATRRGERGLGLPAARVAALTIGAPVLFALATLAASPADAGDGLFWQHAWRCMLATLLVAAGPFGLGLWALRRAFVAAAGWRTAALGVACGGLAAATLALTCSVGTVGHILVGHGAILLIAGALGAGLGRTRLLRG